MKKEKLAEKLKELDKTAELAERDDIVYDPDLLPPPVKIKEVVRPHYEVDWKKKVTPNWKPEKRRG